MIAAAMRAVTVDVDEVRLRVIAAACSTIFAGWAAYFAMLGVAVGSGIWGLVAGSLLLWFCAPLVARSLGRAPFRWRLWAVILLNPCFVSVLFVVGNRSFAAPGERMNAPLVFFILASAAALAFLAGLGALLEARLARGR